MKEAIIQYNDDPNADGNHMVISWKELVRCKDCKYHDEETEENFCDCGNRPDDWFCADGARKDS